MALYDRIQNGFLASGCWNQYISVLNIANMSHNTYTNLHSCCITNRENKTQVWKIQNRSAGENANPKTTWLDFQRLLQKTTIKYNGQS